MSLVAHRFGRVEFQIFVLIFFQLRLPEEYENVKNQVILVPINISAED